MINYFNTQREYSWIESPRNGRINWFVWRF